MFSLLNFIWPKKGKKEEELREAFLQYLEGKYKEEFEFEKIEEVDWDNGVRYLAEFHPVRNPAIKSELTAVDKYKIVGDNYMNVFFSTKLDKILEELLQPIFQSELVIFTYLWPLEGREGWPAHRFRDTKMSLDKYLDAHIKNLEIPAYIFVKSGSELDLDAEADRINQTADILLELGFLNQRIRVYYVNSSGFESISDRTKKYQWKEIVDLNTYIHNNCWEIGTVKVISGEKEIKYTYRIIDEIRDSFDRNKQELAYFRNAYESEEQPV